MKRGTPDHPKTIDLARRLGCSRPTAVGVLECLWHWSARYAPRGDIGRFGDEAIAAGVYWDGDAVQLVTALRESRWLDVSAQHRYLIHDWHEHADEAVKKFLARNKLTFAIMSRHVSTRSRRSLDKSRLPLPLPEPLPLPLPEPLPEENNTVALTVADPVPAAPAARVFDYWRRVMGHPLAVMDRKRERLIQARLREYAVETLCRAIDGCRASAFHMGENDREQVYDGIELICRDAAHVERFLKPAASKKTLMDDPDVQAFLRAGGNDAA